MPEPRSHTARIVELPAGTLEAMRAGLPALIDRMVHAVIAEVPPLAQAAQESWRPVIDASAGQLLSSLIDGLRPSTDLHASGPIQEVLDTAYRFGRREARNGRPPEVQLAAYRVGARELWRDWSALAAHDGVDRDQISAFAEMFFAYLDLISAAGVAGHADEQSRSGRDRERQRERLVRMLLSDATSEELELAAEYASWAVPRTVTAVAIPSGRQRGAAAVTTDPRTLHVPHDAIDSHIGVRVVLVCDVGGAARPPFLASVAGTGAVVGPARGWKDAQSSIRRVMRAVALQPPEAADVLDTEELLPELILRADADALADLRARVLAPLADVPEASRDRLVETLRSWLLHHGRRDNVAADLFVSPSTIRYRLRQLREAYGDRLRDPRVIAELTVALAVNN
ncbi:DNA-binding transcriptional ArsR family regulator [Mycolicibacterium iranicum]|uniref:DNA-binding transcriptional ArsR family regulator n=1 Tax=Mycolicibacterium iranicum TaxID=912594 RepID=A0A839Q797_MYCIR|nr:PucR family transcriptional regulator [Mycolicibacterium iranicum]MBB2989082.1 DNA-binding transcriptional ArsR family regulator [Mycolicibacterium iranicum]